MSYSCSKHVIKYCEKVYERSSKYIFGSIKNLDEILDKLKARDFNGTSLSTCDFSNLYTTLPHNLFKDKLIDLFKDSSIEKALLVLHETTEAHFLLQKNRKKISCMVLPNVFDALTFLLYNFFLFDLAPSCIDK